MLSEVTHITTDIWGILWIIIAIGLTLWFLYPSSKTPAVQQMSTEETSDFVTRHQPNGLKRADDISQMWRNHTQRPNIKSGTQISTMRIKTPHTHEPLDLATVARRASNTPPHIIIIATIPNTAIITIFLISSDRQNRSEVHHLNVSLKKVYGLESMGKSLPC